MSGSSSPTSAADLNEDDSKKKGRGGKRSVTHLSKAQLARKRANDREAQRNIRQRTKEHIENLERKVRELEALQANGTGSSNATLERIYRRNQELEIEIQGLRAQLRAATMPTSPTQGGEFPREQMPTTSKVEWQSGASAGWHPREGGMQPGLGSRPSNYHHAPAMSSNYPGLQAPLEYMSSDTTPQPYPVPVEQQPPLWTSTSHQQHHPHGLAQPATTQMTEPTQHHARYGSQASPNGAPPPGSGWPHGGGPPPSTSW